MTLRFMADDAMTASVDLPAPRMPTKTMDDSGLNLGVSPTNGGNVGDGVLMMASADSAASPCALIAGLIAAMATPTESSRPLIALNDLLTPAIIVDRLPST